MAATILVRDVLFRICTQLVDMEPQFERWNERELVMFLNDAQRAIAKYIPQAFSRVDVIKLAAGSRQSIETIAANSILPGNGETPALARGRALVSVIRNMGADGATPGKSIRLLERSWLDLNDAMWHVTTATSLSGYVFNPATPKYFHVFPAVPATPAIWAEVAYLCEPREITQPAVGATLYAYDGADATTLTVDDTYVDDIVHYVMARAFLKDAEDAASANLASAYASLFTNSINAQATALTGVNPNLQQLPLSPQLLATAGS